MTKQLQLKLCFIFDFLSQGQCVHFLAKIYFIVKLTMGKVKIFI